MSDGSAGGDAFLLAGNLLSGSELRTELSQSLPSTSGRITIASAFLKLQALEWLGDRVGVGRAVRILCRWQARDLLGGSSDLACYELAKSKGWPFFFLPDFHGKLYHLEEHALYIGSANLTARGMSLIPQGNSEVNVRVPDSTRNRNFIEELFMRARRVDDATYEKLNSWLTHAPRGQQGALALPSHIVEILKPPPPTGLLVEDCFQSDGKQAVQQLIQGQQVSSDQLRHDMSLLSIEADRIEIGAEELRALVGSSKLVRWLEGLLLKKVDRSVFFGELSAALHDALLDDPRPYRVEVKQLVSNLLSWIEAAALPQFKIDTPRHSQRIVLMD